jgi:hypothetical protein
MKVTKVRLGLALLLSAGLMGVLSAATKAQEGQKQTDRLIKRGESAMKEVGVTRQQVEKTITLYNSIIEGMAQDARKTYRDLIKAVDESEKKAAGVGSKVQEMETEAHRYFAEWTKSIEGISSESLSAKSQERLNYTRSSYGDALRAGRRAGAEFDLFVESLRDQIVFLGYDLNPAAVASLKEDAAKLNQQAGELFKKIDEVVDMTNGYLQSLKPQ